MPHDPSSPPVLTATEPSSPSTAIDSVRAVEPLLRDAVMTEGVWRITRLEHHLLFTLCEGTEIVLTWNSALHLSEALAHHANLLPLPIPNKDAK